MPLGFFTACLPGLELSSLGYYDNNLHPDPDERTAINEHVAENLREVEEVFAMYEGGLEGVLSVEQEDPVWGGDEGRVKAGPEIAHRTPRPLVVR